MKVIFFLLAFFFIIQNTLSQQLDRQVFSSNGSSLISNGIWLDYTIGEMAVAPYNAGSIVLNQGFHQVYSSNIGILNRSTSADITIFPNPSNGFIQINVSDEMINNSIYRLTDITGRQLSDIGNSSTLLSSKNTVLNISDLPNGIYLLSVLVTSFNSSYVFRLIKI